MTCSEDFAEALFHSLCCFNGVEQEESFGVEDGQNWLPFIVCYRAEPKLATITICVGWRRLSRECDLPLTCKPDQGSGRSSPSPLSEECTFCPLFLG